MNWLLKTATLLGISASLLGCTGQKSSTIIPPASKSGASKDDHDHDAHAHGAGPHNGVIFDLGRVHAEFVVDHGKQEATIYIFGNDEKTPKAVKADKLDVTIKSPEFTVELKPAPQTGDADGKSTKFVGKHEKFGTEQEFEGTVAAVIDGKPSQGEFKTAEAKEKKK